MKAFLGRMLLVFLPQKTVFGEDTHKHFFGAMVYGGDWLDPSVCINGVYKTMLKQIYTGKVIFEKNSP